MLHQCISESCCCTARNSAQCQCGGALWWQGHSLCSLSTHATGRDLRFAAPYPLCAPALQKATLKSTAGMFLSSPSSPMLALGAAASGSSSGALVASPSVGALTLGPRRPSAGSIAPSVSPRAGGGGSIMGRSGASSLVSPIRLGSSGGAGARSGAGAGAGAGGGGWVGYGGGPGAASP